MSFVCFVFIVCVCDLVFCLCFSVVPSVFTGVKNWECYLKLAQKDDLLRGSGWCVFHMSIAKQDDYNFRPKQQPMIFFHHFWFTAHLLRYQEASTSVDERTPASQLIWRISHFS